MMKSSRKRGFAVVFLLGIIVLLIVSGIIYFYSPQKVDAPVNTESLNTSILKNSEVTGNKEDLVSFSVRPGETVSGLLNLSGSVKNAYFFEANIKISLLDSDQNILKDGFGTATTDWMTTAPVTFTSTIDATGLKGKGYILIEKDDPSDREGGPAKKILIPVIFK